MNQRKQKIIIYGFWIIYAVLGACFRYYITFPSEPNFESNRILFGVVSIPYIALGIGWGLHSLIYPQARRSRVGQGVVVGLSTGFGGMTAIILAWSAYKYFCGC